ncbi:GntR family transcriptional regulator [Corynebacterium alimapuense]|uniref:GntR family transcriptional regulator n=1 Tax=Corynebacterium alimapuense TaxID=1576874 RepID=A0A3M8K7I0_9CORY|nr:GntR family transcriptional regulator [Corynebacterium alimapuense]RNE48438.1 GntR family transcriptional regulator [Corynebacterium alimapuense]
MRANTTASGILRAISAGDFEPGEQLVEVDMAKRFGVSRNTLREAFATLIADGSLVRIKNRGVFIASPSAHDGQDLFLARAAIEPAAICWGSQHDVDKLAELVSTAEWLLERGNTDQVAELNQRFHRQLVAGMGSGLLNETMDRLLAQMRLVFLQVLKKQPDFHDDYVESNRRLVDLMVEGKNAEAAALLHDSLVHTGQRIQELLEA